MPASIYYYPDMLFVCLSWGGGVSSSLAGHEVQGVDL